MNARGIRTLVLAMLLVLAQIGAISHALSHLADGSDGGPPGGVCEWCVACTHLTDAAPGADAARIAPPQGLTPAPIAETGCTGIPCRLAYRSQAPPRLS